MLRRIRGLTTIIRQKAGFFSSFLSQFFGYFSFFRHIFCYYDENRYA
ncbi:hypothetical protein HMPREF2738_03415 [Clostridiales bacterium KLE1615]|nr:hypothetical protein HMPREF2738_03415 [Clostridiales bacterium KLE1615]